MPHNHWIFISFSTYQIVFCETQMFRRRIAKLALTHISFMAIAEESCFSMYVFDWIVIVPEQPGILASPRSLLAQDPSQPKIPVSTGCIHAHLAHAYLVFGSCY